MGGKGGDTQNIETTTTYFPLIKTRGCHKPRPAALPPPLDVVEKFGRERGPTAAARGLGVAPRRQLDE